MNYSKNDDFNFLWELEGLLKSRKKTQPPNSYTVRLFGAGLNKILDKLGEEITEFMVASASGNKKRVICEAADALFHLLIVAVFINLSLEHILSPDGKSARAGLTRFLRKSKEEPSNIYQLLGAHLGNAIRQSAGYDGSLKRYKEIAITYNGLFFGVLAMCKTLRLDYSDIEQELLERMSVKKASKEKFNKSHQDIH